MCIECHDTGYVEDRKICNICSGSGEGYSYGTICQECKGEGELDVETSKIPGNTTPNTEQIYK